MTPQKETTKATQKIENIDIPPVKKSDSIAALIDQRKHNKVPQNSLLIKALEDDRIRTSLSQQITHIGNWEWNIVNNTLWWSKEVYEVFGIEPKNCNLTYEDFLTFVHPDDIHTVKQTVNETLDQKKQHYTVEHRIIRPDNTERIISERGEVVYAGSEPIRMIGLLQDVTEDRKKDDRLRSQDLELRSHAQLLDLAHDTIIVHNLDGRIIFWNKGAEHTYGWTKDEAMGENAHTLLKTEFAQPLLKIITIASIQGTWEGELIHTTKNGEKLIVESRWGVQKDEKGEPSAILEIDRDITQRKRAEEKRDEARRFSESVIQTIQEALVVLDPELKVLSANHAFYELFDLIPEETEKQYIYQLAQKQWNIPELRRLLEDILPQNTSFSEYEMKYGCPDGTSKILLLSARRIYRKKEKTEMILLALQDISKLKRREQEIRDLTEQLLMAEEAQRQKIASALHDSIGQILAFSNRELATLQKGLDSRAAGTLSRIRAELSKAIRQTRQLTTDLSSPTLNTFGLQAGIEELADHFSDQHHVECQVEFEGETERLAHNTNFVFYHATRELLCNIAKHAQATHVHIDLKVKDSELWMCIEDDGKGFNVHMMDQFVSEKNCFGLFSMQQRLTNLGGSFTIKSNKEKGTTVTITAPLHAEEKG